MAAPQCSAPADPAACLDCTFEAAVCSCAGPLSAENTPAAGTCWTHNTTGKVSGDGPLTVSTSQGDTLYSVTSSGQLYALDQSSSTLQFQFSCLGANKQAPPGTPLLWNNILYFGCTDQVFYAMDTLLLRLLWQFPPKPTSKKNARAQTLGSFRGAPVTDGRNIYVYTQSQGKSRVVALNSVSGAVVWSTQVGLGGKEACRRWWREASSA